MKFLSWGGGAKRKGPEKEKRKDRGEEDALFGSRGKGGRKGGEGGGTGEGEKGGVMPGLIQVSPSGGGRRDVEGKRGVWLRYSILSLMLVGGPEGIKKKERGGKDCFGGFFFLFRLSSPQQKRKKQKSKGEEGEQQLSLFFQHLFMEHREEGKKFVASICKDSFRADRKNLRRKINVFTSKQIAQLPNEKGKGKKKRTGRKKGEKKGCKLARSPARRPFALSEKEKRNKNVISPTQIRKSLFRKWGGVKAPFLP